MHRLTGLIRMPHHHGSNLTTKAGQDSEKKLTSMIQDLKHMDHPSYKGRILAHFLASSLNPLSPSLPFSHRIKPMKTIFLLWGALVLLSPKGLAQEGSVTPPLDGTQSSKPLSQDTFDNLHHRFVKAQVAVSTQVKELRKSATYQKALKKRDINALRAMVAKIPKPEATLIPIFLKAAEKAKGSPEEAKLLFFALSKSGRNRALCKKIFESLKARHFESKGWGPVLRSLPWILPKDEAKAFISRLAQESPNPQVKIMAKYVAATGIRRDKGASDEDKEAAAKTLEEIKTKHPNSLPGLSLNSPTFIKEHLQIGMKAPDIIGKDVFGKPMKLSDFRGRVVVIDFWGDW
jgi:hypothetical protein